MGALRLADLNNQSALAINNAEIGSTETPIDRAVEIERLASLETEDYEAERKDAAKGLGFRTSVLDNLREQKRREKLANGKGDDGRLNYPKSCLGLRRLREIELLRL